jgi:hypothetical protein
MSMGIPSRNREIFLHFVMFSGGKTIQTPVSGTVKVVVLSGIDGGANIGKNRNGKQRCGRRRFLLSNGIGLVNRCCFLAMPGTVQRDKSWGICGDVGAVLRDDCKARGCQQNLTKEITHKNHGWERNREGNQSKSTTVPPAVPTPNFYGREIAGQARIVRQTRGIHMRHPKVRAAGSRKSLLMKGRVNNFVVGIRLSRERNRSWWRGASRERGDEIQLKTSTKGRESQPTVANSSFKTINAIKAVGLNKNLALRFPGAT